jgi:hypothetical protein
MPPILLMKQTMDDLSDLDMMSEEEGEDEEDEGKEQEQGRLKRSRDEHVDEDDDTSDIVYISGDEEEEGEEMEERPAKRLRDDEVAMVDGTDKEEDDREEDDREEDDKEEDDKEEDDKEEDDKVIDKASMAGKKKKEQHTEKERDKHVEKKKGLADDLVELMMPRMEAMVQQTANSVAMRMLDVLGQKLARLESRIDQMQTEWKRANPGQQQQQKDSSNQHQPAVYQFGNRHQSAVQQYYGRTQAPPVMPNTIRTPEDPLQSFFQEAAQAADSPAIVLSTNPRRLPHNMRRSKAQPAPEYYSQHAVAPDTSNHGPPPDHVPQYRLQRGSESVTELWHEFFVGSPDKPAINELDNRYGSAWRWKDTKEGVYYSMRRVVIDEIQTRVEARCPQASGATGAVWLAVCSEMDAERTAKQSSLNQYIFQLKRRDYRNTNLHTPSNHSRVYSPTNAFPPPSPIISRSTLSIQALWNEWFVGKQDYNGYANFPSIVHLNHRFGPSWRKINKSEYNIYLKRRCIIDIALGRIMEEGGSDKAAATKKVLKAMDAERLARNLSLNTYHTWAREEYSYHAATRTHLPKHIVELGESPEEAIELEAGLSLQMEGKGENGGGGDDEDDGDDEQRDDEHEQWEKRATAALEGEGEQSVPPSPASLG